MNMQEKLRAKEDEIIALKAQVELLKSMMISIKHANGAEVRQQQGGISALPLLTLKQHAALLGICAHLSWEQIADHMKVDRTTVKLHIRAVGEKLGTPGLRSEIAAKWAPVIGAIDDAEYKVKYGLHKRWWEVGVEDRATLALLRTKRTPGPPHT